MIDASKAKQRADTQRQPPDLLGLVNQMISLSVRGKHG
jgi:hypothetical protein